EPSGSKNFLDLIPYQELKGAQEMANIMADAIARQKRLLIVADYDADGATACSVGLVALRAFGANVDYIIPNRIEHGYGLSPEIARISCTQSPKPDFLITVDNGIASHAGIEESNRLGVPVLVTDHHLPTEDHPAAMCIVNPNQHGCSFPSKALAGCGVMFYVMWALYEELVNRGASFKEPDFSILDLLPIVAIGTIADVVALDTNNRILVAEGLSGIHEGSRYPGIDALAIAAQRNPRRLCSSDIAFGVGPRINAAGRLESMNAGVECLTTNSPEQAEQLASDLNVLNEKRKEIESEMVEEAVRRLITTLRMDRYTAVLHAEDWHHGVIGIVAGRIKEKIWRPTFVLAAGKDDEMKGSGRSIPGFHLRDALDLVDKRCPGVLLKFGGHAMAAGVTIRASAIDEFEAAFEEVAKSLLKPSDLNQVIEVDGSLDNGDITQETVAQIRCQVWGQAFPEPLFYDTFKVLESRALSEGKHLKLKLEKGGKTFEAIKFRHSDGPPPPLVNAVYKLDINTYKGVSSLQLMIEHLEPA
ncbi:single-stranded-DNA-specific exonuclease RecJ, partial [Nostoc sp. CHAB 5834]|nr:single-stranded-DNA-specific exonuclease RecJ [Nostoc sp. CHAB 5834]